MRIMDFAAVCKPLFFKKFNHVTVVFVRVDFETVGMVLQGYFFAFFHQDCGESLPCEIFSYANPVNHYIILIAKPLSVKVLVFRFSVDDNGCVCCDFIMTKCNETYAFADVGKYAFAVWIAVLPLVDAASFQRLLGVADNFEYAFQVVYCGFADHGLLFHPQFLTDLQYLRFLDSVQPTDCLHGCAIFLGDFAECISRFNLVVDGTS